MNKLKVSVLQLNTYWEDPQKNLEDIEIKILNNPTADLFVLPEMFNTGFTSNAIACAETLSGYSVERIKILANKVNAAICGSLILKFEDKIYNSMIFVEPDGKIHIYNKRHLFKFGGEDKNFNHGDKRVIIEYKNWKIAMFVCYDLRFPVWLRNTDKYDLLICVANWPQVRVSVLELLTKARAVENACYGITCNRVGLDANDFLYSGASMIVNYKGEVIQRATDYKDEIINAEISLETCHEFRRKFPVLDEIDNFKLL